jgi:transcriptional regulator with XRE-family HTH domain
MPRKKAPNSIAATDVHVGQRLRARRLELQVSQTRLAGDLGITFQQVQKYENGKNRMGSSRLAQAAQILRVNPSYFFENAGLPQEFTTDNKAVAQVTEFLGDKNALALVRAFQKIKSKETRRGIVNLVSELARPRH